MRAKQKKIRIFDITINHEKKFFDFLNKNYLLIKDYLLVISGNITPQIKEELDQKGLCYIIEDENCKIKKIEPKKEPPKKKEEAKTPSGTYSLKDISGSFSPSYEKTKVINKPVRSGEVIETQGDVIVFSRVNSGAKVISEGNVCIFDVIDGVVEANGDYMILRKIDKGYAVFNGDILEKEIFDGSVLKKIIKTKEGFKIEDLKD